MDSVLGQEGGRFDIYSRLDRKTPHHRRCQNLTACASLSLEAGYSDLELLGARIVLEAHARTVVDCCR